MSSTRNSVALTSESPIKDFFSNRGVFLTGATGFVAKVLLEKLVRAFNDIGPIYVLLRPKKGKTIEERLDELLKSRTFTFHEYPATQLAKVIPIAGDIAQPFLGISASDRERLARDVSLVFHSAANVRFDVLLAEHIRTNVLGTRHLVALCKELPRLTCVVYVSTAFSNCHLKEIDEKLYPLKISPDQLIELYNILEPEALEKVTADLIENRPNTYVFTKAVAEHIITEGCKGWMTLAIARPAIVGPAMKEPTVGWVDSVHGPAGLSILAGVGILQTVDWKYEVCADVTSVDLLSNGLIGSAWHMSTFFPKQTKFFNMTSTNMVPVPSGEFFKMAREASMRYPTIYCIRPPMHPPKTRPHPWLYSIQKFWYHVVFAHFLDFILGLVGREKMIVRIVNKMHRAIDLMKFFALNQWKFTSNNYFRLIDDLSPYDSVEFDTDMRKFRGAGGNMIKAIEDTWLGCRRYILNEPDSNVTLARQKYIAVLVFYRLYQVMQLILLWKIIFVWTPIASYVAALAFLVWTPAAQSLQSLGALCGGERLLVLTGLVR